MADITNKRGAQRSVDRIHAFRQQLRELLSLGVLDLSDEQRTRVDSYLDRTLADLAERFDVDTSEKQKQISLGMRILAALGGLAFCAALFLFFLRFWGVLSTPVQVAILIVTPVLCLGALELISRREKTAYYTTLTSLVAIGAFYLNLGVLGSLFNITPSPSFFLAGGSFALVLAYGYRLRLPLAVGLVSLLVFLTATVATWTGGYWEMCLQRPENLLPGSLLLLAVPLLVRHRKSVEFPEVYQSIGLLLLLSTLELLFYAGRMSYLPFGFETVQAGYRILGFVAAGLTIAAGILKSRVGIVNLGSAFFALYLFDQLFAWWWDWMPKYLFFLIIGSIAVGLLAIFRKLRSRTREQLS
jgi:uncharacterized membrane protein